MNDMNSNKETQKAKIQIISEIDHLKVVVNNHVLMKKYYEAIKVSEAILELAKKANLSSIITEQEQFILRISKLIDESKIGFIDENFEELNEKYEKYLKNEDIEAAHDLIVIFQNKYQKLIDLTSISQIKKLLEKDKKLWEKFNKEQDSLKKRLEPLEIQFSSYIKTNNIKLAQDSLDKAEEILILVKSKAIKEMWNEFKRRLNELKTKKDLEEKVSTSLNKISTYTDSYQFKEGRDLIDDLTQLMNKIKSSDYLKQFELKKRALIDAEEKYNKLFNDIESLETSIRNNISSGSFSDAMNNCEQIVKISRFIGQDKYVEMYSHLLKEIKDRIRKYRRLEDVKNIIGSIAEQALIALKDEDFPKSLGYFKKMKNILIEYNKG